jgi:hypothetical protein
MTWIDQSVPFPASPSFGHDASSVLRRLSRKPLRGGCHDQSIPLDGIDQEVFRKTEVRGVDSKTEKLAGRSRPVSFRIPSSLAAGHPGLAAAAGRTCTIRPRSFQNRSVRFRGASREQSPGRPKGGPGETDGYGRRLAERDGDSACLDEVSTARRFVLTDKALADSDGTSASDGRRRVGPTRDGRCGLCAHVDQTEAGSHLCEPREIKRRAQPRAS